MGNSSSTEVDTLINQEVYNELESLMKTSGSSSSSNQTTNLSGVKLVVIGGDKCKEHPVPYNDNLIDNIDINNKNVKNIACVMDTISDVTSKLDGTVETEASTTVKNGSNTTMYMIIGIIVLIIIVALIFYFSPVTGIIILILVIVIVVGIGIYYFNK